MRRWVVTVTIRTAAGKVFPFEHLGEAPDAEAAESIAVRAILDWRPGAEIIGVQVDEILPSRRPIRP